MTHKRRRFFSFKTICSVFSYHFFEFIRLLRVFANARSFVDTKMHVFPVVWDDACHGWKERLLSTMKGRYDGANV